MSLNSHNSPSEEDTHFKDKKTETERSQECCLQFHSRLSHKTTSPQFSDAHFLQTKYALNATLGFFPSHSAVIKSMVHLTPICILK